MEFTVVERCVLMICGTVCFLALLGGASYIIDKYW